MLIKICFSLTSFKEKLQNDMINQIDFNTNGTELEFGLISGGAYNRIYFSFTAEGPITGCSQVAVYGNHKRTKLPSCLNCFITSFYKRIFPTFIGWEMVVVQPLR